MLCDLSKVGKHCLDFNMQSPSSVQVWLHWINGKKEMCCYAATLQVYFWSHPYVKFKRLYLNHVLKNLQVLYSFGITMIHTFQVYDVFSCSRTFIWSKNQQMHKNLPCNKKIDHSHFEMVYNMLIGFEMI